MKRNYVARIICCVVFLLIGASLSWGQKSARRDDKRLSCSAGNVAFTCPEGFKPVQSWPKVTLFFMEDVRLGFFVAAPEAGFNEVELWGDILAVSLDKLFPEETPPSSWEGLDFEKSNLLSNSNPMSKFEVGGGLWQGFNGTSRFLFKYRHVRFKGQAILVGYLLESGMGAKAKEDFEQGILSDSVPGCQASLQVIYSITGEKVGKGNPPCALILLK